MRQSRRGAPLGWLLALLLPLLVSGGLNAGGATALLGHTAVAAVSGEHQPLSRQVHAGGEQHAFTGGSIGTGTGGGHPSASGPPDTRHLSRTPGFDSRPAGDDNPRPLAALLVRPGRAPPSTGV